MDVYAIIKTGGKQYRVSPGDVVQVEKLPVPPGGALEITDVFMLVQGDDVAVGTPTVANVRVRAEVVAEGRGEKIRIFKKRRRKHYQKSMGHRQYYSAIRIIEIVDGDRKFSASDHALPAEPKQQKRKTSSSGQAREQQPDPIPGMDKIPAPTLIPTHIDTPTVAALAATPVPEFPAPLTETRVPTVDLAPSGPSVPATSDVETSVPNTETVVGFREVEPASPPAQPVPALPALDASPVSAVDLQPAAPAHSQATPAPKVSRARGGLAPIASRPITDAVPASASSKGKNRQQRVLRFMIPLAVLLGVLGWLFKGDRKPASGVRVDAQPTVPETFPTTRTTFQVTPPPPAPQPTIKEIGVRKPARASAPSAPTQPPD